MERRQASRAQSWTGLLLVIGGLVLAYVAPEPDLLGFPYGAWLALIGAERLPPGLWRRLLPTKEETP